MAAASRRRRGDLEVRVANPLISLIPPTLVRRFARPYVAGDSLPKGVDAAARLWAERRIQATLDLLAEDISDIGVAQANEETYIQLIDAIADDARFDAERRPSISVKPSSYTLKPLDKYPGGDAPGSREAIERICRHAHERGVNVTVDMESAAWTDFTLELLGDLHREGLQNVGAALQTRLNRTFADIERLPPGCRVRLVIGIYEEPAAIAIDDKIEMKERMLEMARLLLLRGHYVEFAGHDRLYVRHFVDEVAPACGATPEDFEIQMLYGVPRDPMLDDLVARGITCRLYLPFAHGWAMAIAYLRRRLEEYPAMMLLTLADLLHRTKIG